MRGPGQALRCHGKQECPSTRSVPCSRERPLYLISRGVVRTRAVGWDKSCLPHILATIHQGHLCVMRGRFWSEPWPWHFPLSLDCESVGPAPSAMEAPRGLKPLIPRSMPVGHVPLSSELWASWDTSSFSPTTPLCSGSQGAPKCFYSLSQCLSLGGPEVPDPLSCLPPKESLTVLSVAFKVPSGVWHFANLRCRLF